MSNNAYYNVSSGLKIRSDFSEEQVKQILRRSQLIISDIDHSITSEFIVIKPTLKIFKKNKKKLELLKKLMKNSNKSTIEKVAKIFAKLLSGTREIEIKKKANTPHKPYKRYSIFASRLKPDINQILITYGFSLFSTPFTKGMKNTKTYSRHLLIYKGVLTGKVLENLTSKSFKKKVIKKIKRQKKKTIGIGNSSEDIPILKNAEISIAVNPDEKLLKKYKPTIIISGKDPWLDISNWIKIPETE